MIKKITELCQLIFKSTENIFFKITISNTTMLFHKQDPNIWIITKGQTHFINFDEFIKKCDKSFLDKLTVELERITLICL